MRYALYFTPAEDDPLTEAAVSWLGRDAETGDTVSPPPVEGLRSDDVVALTQAPRRYGFHGTLKAPFRLAADKTADSLIAAMHDFCATAAPFAIPQVTVARLGGFFALMPSGPAPALEAFAAQVVRTFEPFRAPLSEADYQRRRPERLSERQRQYLREWGYPYVFEEFRFHMTLTGEVDETRAAPVAAALEARFAPLLTAPLKVRDLALFVEPAPGEPFDIHARVPLAGTKTEKDQRQ